MHGFSENPVVPYIEGDVTTDPGTSVNDVDNVTDSTIVAELANGKTYVLRNAWRANRSEINLTVIPSGENDTIVRFSCQAAA